MSVSDIPFQQIAYSSKNYPGMSNGKTIENEEQWLDFKSIIRASFDVDINVDFSQKQILVTRKITHGYERICVVRKVEKVSEEVLKVTFSEISNESATTCEMKSVSQLAIITLPKDTHYSEVYYERSSEDVSTYLEKIRSADESIQACKNDWFPIYKELRKIEKEKQETKNHTTDIASDDTVSDREKQLIEKLRESRAKRNQLEEEKTNVISTFAGVQI